MQGLMVVGFLVDEILRVCFNKSCHHVFMAPLTRRKTKFSGCIPDDIPPQMKRLNTVIP